MPTNPFTSSSSNRRQQILMPKELFPRKNSSNLINGVDSSSSSSSYRRPVKLPLRKHHSFHFQSSQTVAGAGALRHEQFQPSKQSTTHQQQSTKERYRSQGPLVFKPFSEKSAFKPIVPSKGGGATTHDSTGPLNGYDISTMPRICGTSLKRHISNVETFSTTANQWHQSDDNEDNAVVAAASEDLATPQSTGDANRRRKIHYADLAPLPTSSAASNLNALYQRSDRNNNSSSNENSDNIDSSSSGTSERHIVHGELNKASSTTVAPAQATTTQYATLRFDEVNI